MSIKESITELYGTAEVDYEFYFKNGFTENQALKMGYFINMDMPKLDEIFNKVSENFSGDDYDKICFYLASAVDIVKEAHAKSKRIKLVIE